MVGISKYMVVIAVIVGLLCAAPLLSAYSVTAQTVGEGMSSVVADNIRIFKAEVTSVTNISIVVESEEFSGELIAKGRWVAISRELVSVTRWIEARDLVDIDDALIVMITISKESEAKNILLGLKQDDILLIRPCLIKHYAEKKIHTKSYLGIYGKIISKGRNYMLIERNEHKALVLVGENSTWYKAGYGVVTWKDVRGEFREGDVVRIFCHNVLIFREKFAEYLGFKAIIWGYSGAIIDLTSGTAITRYVSK